MIRESLADSNQIQWQVLAKSLQLQLTDSRLWQVLYIYSNKCYSNNMKDHNCFKILDLVASIAAFHWSICIKYAVHWRKSKLAELNPKVWNCQAQVQSQIQVPNPSLNPSPKSKIQSPEKRDCDWGWHYNPTGHYPSPPLTWNVNPVMGKDHQ